MFCLLAVQIITGDGIVSQSPVEDHRCSAYISYTPTGKSYISSQSPVEDHRCSAIVIDPEPTPDPTESQSPVEDHRCSAGSAGTTSHRAGGRHSPLSRIIVVLPAYVWQSDGCQQRVTVPCRGSSLFCPNGGFAVVVVRVVSQSPVEDHRCSARRPSLRQRLRLHVTVPCRGSSLFCPDAYVTVEDDSMCHSPLSRIIVVLPYRLQRQFVFTN